MIMNLGEDFLMISNNLETTTVENEFCLEVYFTKRNLSKFFSKILREFNLTFPQYVSLLILWQEEKPIRMNEMTERLQLDYGTTSPLFKRMEKNQWILRRYSPSDKRKVYLELTAKGKEMERIINARVKEYLNTTNRTKNEYAEELQSIHQINQKFTDVNNYLEDLF